MFATLEAGGKHNENIDATTARLIEAGSWKDQKIVVIVPAASMVHAKVAICWMNLAFPPNQARVPFLAQGTEVGEAYSIAIEAVLGHPDLSQWPYILTVEHDNVPPPFAVIDLLKAMEEHPEYDCISGLYFTKGEGGCAQIWGNPMETPLSFKPQPPKANEIVECCGTGMGFALWRMSMFKDERLARPLFKTKQGEADGGLGTQDLAFWAEARKYGYRCAVDCRVKVGHIDTKTGEIW